MKALKMPEELRPKLAEGPKKIFAGENPIKTVEEALNKTTCDYVIAVGDVICYTLIKAGKTPNICVIDRKTQRKEVNVGIDPSKFSKTYQVKNPAGHITLEAIKTLNKALKEAVEENLKVLIVIDGEEDLLALPLIKEAPNKTCVFLGMPNVGVGVVEVNQQERKNAEETLSKFTEVELGS